MQQGQVFELKKRAVDGRAVCAYRYRTDGPGSRQELGRQHQGALPAVPQGASEDGRQDRRHPQAARLHLIAKGGIGDEADHREGLDHHLQRLP